ncbi:MAG: hypothetical protein MJ245_07810 [Clostridia bacterium]|nr:hypothetical protein [Clostridia bacterium]
MKKNMGFISLHRSMLNWEWYDDINVSRLFIHLLLKVNYQDKTWHGYKVNRGSLITSYANLSKETGLSIHQVRTALDKLKMTGEVTCKVAHNFTIINVVKYKDFQDLNFESGTPHDKRVANEWQQLNKVNKENNIYIKSKVKSFKNYSENKEPSPDEIKNMKSLMKKYGNKI